MIETLVQDVRYAVRSMLRRPLISAAAVLSLALGIGVNSALFSLFDRLVLRQLPVPAPEQLVTLTSPGPRPGNRSTGDSGGVEAIFSYPLFRDLERLENTGMSRFAAHSAFGANLAYRGQTASGEGVLVSGSYFPVLGVTPFLGRLLSPDDDRAAGGHPVVVLSHGYWSTRFGADPSVVGQTLTVNGEPMTIVGVTRPAFRGTTTMDLPQVFVPLAMALRMRAGWKGMDRRNDHWLYLFARLQPGITRPEAESLANVPFTAIIKDVEYPALRSGMGDRAREQFQARRLVLRDGARGGGERQRDEARTILSLFFAVTGFVLLIACANVANLMLARTADRATEIAVRRSMGASTWRMIRLLFIEALALGAAGAAGALLVAPATVTSMLSLMPAEDDVVLLGFELNASVVVFTLILGLGTSLMFGLFPAVHAVRGRLAAALSAHSGRSSGSRTARRVRTSLATSQIALATALLGVAGLFVASLISLARVELGIRREGLVSFRLSPSLNGYTPERSRAFFEQVADALSAIPGVTSVSETTIPLLDDSNWGQNVTVEGYTPPPDSEFSVSFARIGPDYFRTVGVPLLAGRELTRADAGTSPKVAIVNEAFARRFQLGSQVVGKRMALGAGDRIVLDVEIVGLVRDAKYSEVRLAPPPQLFMPYRQIDIGSLTFYARTAADVRELLRTIPATVARLDPNLPIDDLRTMDEQIWENVTPFRVMATMAASFAGLATLLAAIGLYAVLAYGISQRFREIGIRMALGARGCDVWRLIFAHVGRMTLVGSVIGVAAAIGLGRLGESLLFGVDGGDAVVIGSAAAAMIVVALCAGAIPARRAAGINPVEALRAE